MMSASSANPSDLATDGQVIRRAPKASRTRSRQALGSMPIESAQSSGNAADMMLAQNFILAARQAQAEGDTRLAEHLLEVAYELFDGL